MRVNGGFDVLKPCNLETHWDMGIFEDRIIEVLRYNESLSELVH